MRRLYLFVVPVLLCCLNTTVDADIYTWIDENGVKHFSNFAPPANAEVIMKTEELPYDEEADQQRMAAERQERLLAAWQELADKEAELLNRQQAAAQEIEAANIRAQQALKEAEALLDEAEERYNSYSSRGYGYYPFYGHYKRWYYRNNLSLYYKYPHYKHRYKHKYKHKRRPYPKYYDRYPKHYKSKRPSDSYYKQRTYRNPRQSLKRHSYVNGHRFNGRLTRFGRTK